MLRTILFSLAIVLIGTVGQAEEPKAKTAYHVYTAACRGDHFLAGTYSSAQAACQVAAELRAKGSRVSVMMGTDGKKTWSTITRQPSRYLVYAHECPKSGWQLDQTFADSNRAQERATALKKERSKVEIITDYTPREVFCIHGGPCRRGWQLLGRYLTAEQACDAAQAFRAKKLQYEVTTWMDGLGRRPYEYRVYVQGCKKGWSVHLTTREHAKAQKMLQARLKEGKAAELVLHVLTK
jgi:hypothetical protein